MKTYRHVPRSQWNRIGHALALAALLLAGARPDPVIAASTEAKNMSEPAASAKRGGRQLIVYVLGGLKDPEICKGDSRPIAVLVYDKRTLAPVGGADVTANYSGGGFVGQTGPNGGLEFNYTAAREGPDTITVTASKAGYNGNEWSGVIKVTVCEFELEMLYIGGYSFLTAYTFTEAAVISPTRFKADGNPATAEVHYDLSLELKVAGGLGGCHAGPAKGSSTVKLRASFMGDLMPGMLLVTMVFSPQTLGQWQPACGAMGYYVSSGEPWSPLDSPINSLGQLWPLGFTVPSNTGSATSRVTRALFINSDGGSGAAVVKVRRVSGDK